MANLTTRILILATAVGILAGVNIVRPWEDDGPSTQLGTAGVELGEDTARIVERVAYRQEVERVGDVIVIDGQPRDDVAADLDELWAIVDATWPTSLRDELAQLSVVREDERGLVGVVHPSVTGGWILSLDIADVDDRALIEETIVHELSHVVTLDNEVFTFGEVDGCSGTQIALGCAVAGSVLSAFAERFWPGDVGSTQAEEFVNDYASTAAHEDLAETFTGWVLGWPLEGATVEAKIAMLSADPDLAALAADLRARLLA
ncbi:MAG: hypothetical protein DHS20C19_06060 [Acidimicrobiales bacterium]|nr:MAG: hypothetical protein DHS20C19_06060 [Acidimicrobiales bacterium]